MTVFKDAEEIEEPDVTISEAAEKVTLCGSLMFNYYNIPGSDSVFYTSNKINLVWICASFICVWLCKNFKDFYNLVCSLQLPLLYGFCSSSLYTKVLYMFLQASLLEESIKPRANLPPLLVNLEDRRPEKLHYLGVSFGLTQELFRFWRKHSFYPFYVGQIPVMI